MMDIFDPSLSLQASDGPPGKIGFPGPQVRLCSLPPSCHLCVLVLCGSLER